MFYNKLFIVLTCLFTLVQGFSQNTTFPYTFTTSKEIKCTPVENQFKSGTCWSFSSSGFFESEMIRLGKKPINFSEMFVVRHSYADKAIKYVRMHGNLNFGPGGAFHDVKYVLEKYGMVPEDIYTGLLQGEKHPVHAEMDNVLQSYVESIVKNKNKKLSKEWHKGFTQVLDAYLGKLPERFTYEGKSYTPQSFAQERIGLKLDDYVNITSYMHHPFYKEFIIEIPDNWANGKVMNVPLDEMMSIVDYALNNGYSIAWGADVSEEGFSWKDGVAIVPDEEKISLTDTEQSRWETLSTNERKSKLFTREKPVTEKIITQEMRQEAFDNYLTTDDHGMQLVGIARDQNDNVFYKVKNSWGTENHKYDGFFYVSKPYVAYKTMNFLVHKDGIPKNIKAKIGL